MGDDWKDIDVSDDIVEALAAVIRRHVPHDGQFSDEFEAGSIVLAFLSPTGFYDAWDADKEEAKLDNLIRTARHLVHIERSLHPSVRCQLEVGASNYMAYWHLDGY